MTYFSFLAIFVALPSIVMAAWLIIDQRRGKTLPLALSASPPLIAIGVHMLVALVYTTPWDNYLVATRVWWYDPELVTGIVFGWVPIEEYTFFLLQPVFTGLFLFTLMRYLPVSNVQPTYNNRMLRIVPTAMVGVVWLAAAFMLIAGWQPGTYLGLMLVWALPPIMLQLVFGADTLWRHRRIVLLAITVPTLYLAVADSTAIFSGTWTINPEQSIGILLGGVLPVEEFLFFLLTNVLLVFGVTLVVAQESHQRMPNIIRRWLPFLVNEKTVKSKQAGASR